MNNDHTISELIPVKWKRNFLTPTTRGRAYYLVTHKKAKWFKTKNGVQCIRMIVEPSGTIIDDENIVMGLDPGVIYDGVSIVNENGSIHFENVFEGPERQSIKNSKISRRIDKKAPKGSDKYFEMSESLIHGFLFENSERRRNARRLKRSHLRHRTARFKNRIGNRLTNTQNFYIQHRKNLINEFDKLFHFSSVNMEMTNHFPKRSRFTRNFSNMETVQYKVLNYLSNVKQKTIIKNDDTKTGYFYGYNTAKLRERYVEIVEKDKVHKGLKTFNTHCIDSFVLANYELHTEMKNMTVRFRKIRLSPIRRRMTIHQNLLKTNKDYFRYAKGGVKVPINRTSKLKTVRVKLVGEMKSNHGPWRYVQPQQFQTFHKKEQPFGGTVWRNKNSKKSFGQSKRLVNKRGEILFHGRFINSIISDSVNLNTE